jgi:hypothetical protein
MPQPSTLKRASLLHCKPYGIHVSNLCAYIYQNFITTVLLICFKFPIGGPTAKIVIDVHLPFICVGFGTQ